MKGFFIAALASFVGGVLVILFQQFVVEKTVTPTIQKVAIDHAAAISFSGGQLDHVRQAIFDGVTSEFARNERASVDSFSVRNVGNTDLDNVVVELQPFDGDLTKLYALGESSIEPPVGTAISQIDQHWKEVSFDPKSDSIDLKVPLLKQGESIRIAMLGSSVLFPKMTLRSKNVAIADPYADSVASKEEEGLGWNWAWIIAFVLSAFFLGIGISEYFHRQALAKIGFDYNEVMKAYQEAVQKNG